ncbi:MAG: methyltransferase domain-containing protein [Gammaproteobacteria bacterium]|nr:methyltransferase domain-containing protein [Gammaproteobacteria bacterium]MBI5617356.1 methyltransferase domain-containing protein [Gammaproteobacteria bacterium]
MKHAQEKPLTPGAGSTLTKLREWFETDTGRVFADIECELARSVLPNLFGYHLVQLGMCQGPAFSASSRISLQLCVGLDSACPQDCALVCAEDALPFAEASIDVLVLPHVLEFGRDPYGVLREAERVLIGEGHLLILGFSPWSLFGLWRLSLGWRSHAPWSGRHLRLARVKDWLSLLGFDIVLTAKASYRPPLGRMRTFRGLDFLERFGAYFWPFFGNIYMIVAKKRVLRVRPVKSAWLKRRSLVAGGVAEPSIRSEADAGAEAACRVDPGP